MSSVCRRPITAALAACVLLVLCTGSLAAQDASVPRGMQPPAQLLARARSEGTVRVLVRMRGTFTAEERLSQQAAMRQRRAIADGQDAVAGRLRAKRRIRRLETVPVFAAEVDATELQRLAADSSVATIHEDVAVPPALAESTAIVGAPQAWSAGFSGAGWTVAVLDTGIDASHPFLAGKVVSEACYSSAVPGQSSSLCPNGSAASIARGSGANCAAGVTGCDHGTHVAGIVAGRGAAFSGVARDAAILSIQVYSRFEGCGTGGAGCVRSWTSDQMLALERVYQLRTSLRIAAVNMSLGGSVYGSACDDDPRKPLIDQLRAAGIATVIASGNHGATAGIAVPACISSAISVGSTEDGSAADPVDSVSWFSDSSAQLTILAPGDAITSSVPGGGFTALRGTSMAAPHIAGALAVLRSRAPDASVSELIDVLTSTGRPVRDPGNGLTRPRAQLDLAVAALHVPCSFALAPGGPIAAAPAGGPVSITVNTASSCPWSASSDSPWITIAARPATAGGGTVTFAIDPNRSAMRRTAAISIADTTIAIVQNGQSAIAGDFSGDGRPDLLWQNQSTGQIAAWMLEGAALRDTRWIAADTARDPGWKIAATADLNGDGDTDLVWQNTVNGDLEAWLMSGVTRADVVAIAPSVTDAAWHIVGAGDFNADGHPDLVWQHDQGWIAVWYLDGTTRIGTTYLTPSKVDAHWKIRGVADFNRDNKPDLVWQHDEGSLAVWFMDDIGVQDTRYLTISSVGDPDWRIVAVADLNRDLRADLIWQHQTTGYIATWFMWDNTVLDTSFLAPNRVTDTSWKIVGPR